MFNRAGVTASRAYLQIFGVLALLAVTSTAASAGPKSLFHGAGPDFAAFYCSGEALAHHQNPYLVEPLRSCEERVQPSPGRSSAVVNPSPLPGYDLAFFGLLARLPYNVAKSLWFLALFASLGLATFALSRLTRLPALAVFVFLLSVDGILNFTYGQIPPLVVGALAIAAYLVERRRYVAAAIAASTAMIEPNVGLPACLAMAIFLPRCRITLIAAACALALIAIVTGGVAQNVAYFTTYLPAQARAELVATDQFSLSALLHLAGFHDRLALFIGSLSYAGMLVVGIYLGRRAARAFGTDAFIVLLPPAAALLGGSYVHDIQFAVALPVALLLFAKTNPNRYAPWIAVTLLIFPWFSYSSGGHAIGLATRAIGLISTAWLAAMALSARTSLVRYAGIAAAVLTFVALLIVFRQVPATVTDDSTIPVTVQASGVTASANWGAYLRATPSLSTISLKRELQKVPFWTGILLMLIVVATSPIPDEASLEKSALTSNKRSSRTPALANLRNRAAN